MYYLQTLKLANNRLPEAPSIGCLSQLKVLDLSGNLLVSLPKDILIDYSLKSCIFDLRTYCEPPAHARAHIIFESVTQLTRGYVHHGFGADIIIGRQQSMVVVCVFYMS